MTDEDDASSSSKLTKNDNEGTSYDECKGILNIFNGEDERQHQQEEVERKTMIQDCDVKDEYYDDDEIDLNEDKLNGDDNDELDNDSMLMLNGKIIQKYI